VREKEGVREKVEWRKRTSCKGEAVRQARHEQAARAVRRRQRAVFARYYVTLFFSIVVVFPARQRVR